MSFIQLIEQAEDLRAEYSDLKVTAIYHPHHVTQERLIELETALQNALDLIDREISLDNQRGH